MTRMTKPCGTRNVLVDLGFSDVEQLTAKAILAKKINDILRDRGLAQADTARLLGMTRPKMSALRNYKLRGILLERRMQALPALGQHVKIVVSQSTHRATARIEVTV